MVGVDAPDGLRLWLPGFHHLCADWRHRAADGEGCVLRRDTNDRRRQPARLLPARTDTRAALVTPGACPDGSRDQAALPRWLLPGIHLGVEHRPAAGPPRDAHRHRTTPGGDAVDTHARASRP